MACQYAGISITPDTFIDRYLPRASFTYENGKAIGYHPNDYFMGNPYTNNGFGCYAPCIEKAVNKFLPAGYTMVNTTGKSLSSLCKTYLDKGIPVVTWATMYMVAPGKGASWISAFRQLSRAKQTTTRYAGGKKGYTKKLTDQLQ